MHVIPFLLNKSYSNLAQLWSIICYTCCKNLKAKITLGHEISIDQHIRFTVIPQIQNALFKGNFEMGQFYSSVVCESTFYSRQLIFQKIRNKTLGLMITPKRNECVSFALSNTHLKVYGKGTKVDGIREIATITTSVDISRLNVVIAFRFSEHVWHTLDNAWVKFEWYKSRRNWITCC